MPAASTPAPHRRGPGRGLAALLVVALAVLLSGCQVKVAVDTKVNADGSGTLSVGVGLDDKALARLGDPNAQIKTDDMRAAGWTVGAPAKEADGMTWIRGSKPFADAAELNRVIAELTGPNAMFKDYAFQRVESDAEITYRLTGVIDSSRGMAAFGDAELAGQLNGDAFGGQLAKIEAEEGRPIADMVTFDVTASVSGGAPTTYRPTLRDTKPIAVDVATVEQKPPPLLQRLGLYLAIALGIALVVAMLVGARRRFTAAH